jgi:hypothetical protein
MNLNSQIESSETRLKQILENYFVSEFGERELPSHGLAHHRRVWNYCKEIANILYNKGLSFSDHFFYNLIVAAYLHDIGMIVDSGPRHGKHSREMCNHFLRLNQLSIDSFNEALEAVEFHDRKDYNPSDNKINLLTILSLADDLDAFGFTGIFRYAEIYLLRNIGFEDLGSFIMDNASARFNHFIKIIGYQDSIVEKHKKRYLILDDFFKEYNIQVLSYKFGTTEPTGYCGVIEIISKLIENRVYINDFLDNREQFKYDHTIRWYFNGLASDFHEQEKI